MYITQVISIPPIHIQETWRIKHVARNILNACSTRELNLCSTCLRALLQRKPPVWVCTADGTGVVLCAALMQFLKVWPYAVYIVPYPPQKTIALIYLNNQIDSRTFPQINATSVPTECALHIIAHRYFDQFNMDNISVKIPSIFRNI